MVIFLRLLSLLGFLLTLDASCQPGPDGRYATVQLGSPSNVTAPYGSDVQFICCGGHKWTYETDDGYPSREIGPHPEAAGAPDKRPPGVTAVSTERTGTIPTTVYTMPDDKGRLILFINNANSKDTGHYRCHGDSATVDAFLAVSKEPHFVDENQSSVILNGDVIKRQVMFASDQLNKVIIHCPVSGSQTIQSWLWREPILPSSEDYDKVPKGKPPSRTVTANKAGVHESGYVEIGPGLAWARIRDPLSPEAPVKLWCQFEMPSQWEKQEPIVAYYMLDWELYEPINPRVYILTADKPDSTATPGSVDSGFDTSNAGMNPPSLASGLDDESVDIGSQIEQAQLMQQHQQTKEGRPIVSEHKPARLACQFRVIDDPNQHGNGEAKQRVPLQQVYWYRNGQPVHVPPFHVDNSHVAGAGLSLLEVRAYPVLFEPTAQSNTSWGTVERITCAVSSQVKSKPVYKVTTNASLDVDVILLPRMINKELLSAERRVGDALKLTCTALANGPPEMQFEFSQASGADKDQISEWRPVEPRYELSVRRLPADAQNPFLQRLVLEISDLRRTDHGLYRCSVWNQAGRVQAIGHLLVHSEPQIQVVPHQTTYYVSHKPWRVSCHVTGYPLSSSTILEPSTAQPNEGGISEGTTERSGNGNLNDEMDTNQPGNDKPVRMILSRSDGQPLEQVEMKLIDYKTSDFLGINATYEILISPGSGNSTVVRCEYQGRDRRLVHQEKTIFEATQPTKPNISVTCVGPRAVVFSITNPHATPESPPTERIVTQKVIFAPIDTFQNSANLGSMIVYLDSNGQPSATPTNQSSKPSSSSYGSLSSWYNQPPIPRPVTIPVQGLMADTKYVFEWSSGNEFGLSAMEQFTLWTKKLETLPAIYKITFLKPTVGYLRFSTVLDDPCPYGVGARAELSDIVVRYRLAKEDKATGNQVGVGEWSEAEVCRLVTNPTDQAAASEQSTSSELSYSNPSTETNVQDKQSGVQQDQSGIAWSGTKPITCEFPVSNTQTNYEVQVATRNRFDRSEWFTAIYQPALAVHAAAICFPTCGLSGLGPHQLLMVILLSVVSATVHFNSIAI